MTLVVSTNNAIFFLIALELMLASYALIIFEHKKEETFVQV